MPDEPDILEEGGLEPAVEAPEGAEVDAESPEAVADAPITFTAAQLAEHLPQFQERFLAHHDPAEALALYGQRDRNVQAALTRYTQGAPTDEDVETLRESGYEIPEPAEEAPEPIWGAPWVDPSDYDGIVQMVQTDPSRAMAFIDKQPEGVIDPSFRQQVLAYWASPEGGNDPAAMVAYERQKARDDAIEAARAYSDERYAELEQRLTPIQERAAQADFNEMKANVTVLASRAMSEVPNFADHEEGVIKLMEDRAGYDPTYLTRLFALPLDQQLQEVYDLTGVVAYRAIPAVKAEADAAAATAEQAKLGAAGQRGRGAAGASNSPQSDLKRRHMESFQKLKDVDVTV